MKNFFVLVVFVTVVGSAVHFLSAAEHKEARVTQRVNDVRLLAPNIAPRPASVNDNVRDGTAVRTGTESRAELTFIDQTIARLGANTVFNVGTEPHSYELGNGAILMYAPKEAGTVKINTSVATAAVSGFTILFEFHKNSWSKFIVLEGEGTFSFTGLNIEPCQIHPGQIIVIPPHPTRCPEPHYVDLSKLVKTAGLITQFPPLPSLDLILTTNNPPPPGGFVDPTGIDPTDQGTNAHPTPPPPRPSPDGEFRKP
jgi:hypothetical protein